ncbi:Lrp/AsnC family transcriptional regulator [Acinetobacter baumannii]|uniref:Lrp/AsnC family transcriptional regulator n=1 Tax=Acinetobacter baumannii TaxID=470 RepID=UPI002DB92BD7|nr:Lrp/AsnC family transcriptional regulator [Acinetobacter baumannii]MEB6636313.1 Lrp/AsnC family transcriptional regulator [Acinetobacter baumannii]
MIIDKFDYALLEIIQKDCLIPLRELADLVHLSTASVQRRIKKLRENGYIIGNVAILNPEKMSQVITVIIEVRVKKTHITDVEKLKESFSRPEVQQCYYVTGEADFMLVLLVPNMTSLQRICDELFHNNENIQWFKTTVVLERVKTTLLVPL